MANVFTMQPFSQDELREQSQPDPQAHYSALAKCPVHRGPDGTITLTKMQDIVRLTGRAEVLGPGADGPTMGAARPLLPLDLDGPEHTRFRKLLDPLFSAARVAPLAAQVRRIADELIDRFIDRGSADLQADFCEPLPSIFFLDLMGLPAADREQFIDFKNKILGHLPPGLTMQQRMAAHREASARCYEYLGKSLDAPHGDDLIGWLLAPSLGLSREQVLDISYLMIIAGLDTTSSALASILVRLAREPALRQRLVREPALWPAAIEELLRFECPVQSGFRTTRVELEIGGETIPKDTTFFLSWSAANFDEAAFARPLELDPERKPNPHIAFGAGFHRCLGTHLARMELRVALEALHARIPDYELTREVIFSGKPRWPNGVPVRF